MLLLHTIIFVILILEDIVITDDEIYWHLLSAFVWQPVGLLGVCTNMASLSSLGFGHSYLKERKVGLKTFEITAMA